MPARTYPLELAQAVAEEVSGWLAPVCTRLQVVGSVRRQAPKVHNVDLLVIPRGAALEERLIELVIHQDLHIVPRTEPQVLRVVHRRSGMRVTIFSVGRLEQWWVSLVALTGSSGWLRRLRRETHGRVAKLHPDGKIEVLPGEFIWPRSEAGVFGALCVPNVPPAERV